MPSLKLEGDLDVQAVYEAQEYLDLQSQDETPLVLDLSEADLDDGAATAALADMIRTLDRKWGGVTLIEPPQVLAHTLYRIGALASPTLRLIQPREELGTTS